MARPSNFPDSRLAILRCYLCVPQQELAGFLGISRSLLANLEANRRSMSLAVYERAAPLLDLLPESALLVALAAPTAPPVAPAPLDAHRNFCVWRAANLRYELRALNKQPAVSRIGGGEVRASLAAS